MKAASEFANLSFSLECAKIFLRCTGSEPLEISGPGEVWQDKIGTIQFKVFLSPEGRESLAQHMGKPRRPGQFLGEDDHFKLEAHAFNGTVWSADSIFPSRITGYDSGLTSGTVNQLRTTVRLPQKVTKTFILVRFHGKINFPANLGTQTITTIGKQERFSSTSFSVANVKAGRYQFEVCHEDEHTVVAASVPNSLDEMSVVTRIQDALQFVTGKEMTPLAVETTAKNIETSTLLSGRITATKGSIHPPLKASWRDFDGHFWRMFIDYFRFIAPKANERWHPVSDHINMTIESSVGSLAAGVLALAVAVEGIAANTLPNEEKKTAAEFIADLDRAAAALVEVQMSETARKRIKGSLDAMRRIRTTDLLKSYIDEHQYPFSKGTYEAWQKLRNTVAHGCGIGDNQIETTIERRDIVTALLYSLVLDAIGYSGPRIDYGQPGWPTVQRKVLGQPKKNLHNKAESTHRSRASSSK